MQLVNEAQLKQAIEHLGYGAVIDAMAAAFIAYSKGKWYEYLALKHTA